MHGRFFRTALILGLISAVGPFAIDMYLPALPSVGASLRADRATVQMSLTVFFIALGACQLIYGPISDRFGRKPPICFGLVLFAIASIGCALAPTIASLIAFRTLEAVGGCAGMVIPRAIVRDLHTGAQATRLMSLLLLVFSISPILAPLTGSLIIAVANWRGVFWTVTAAAVLGLVLTVTQLEETHPRAARARGSLRSVWRAYHVLLSDRGFLGLVWVGTFSIGAFFVYLASSAFVLIGHYGLSPASYSLFFALNAIAFFGAAQLNGWLAGKFGLLQVVRAGVAGFALTMLVLLLVVALGVQALAVLAALLFMGFGCVGLIVPTTSVLALERHGAIAGTASALMGALQLLGGAVIMGVAGVFADGTALPMVAGIAGCAIIAWVLARLTLPAPAAPAKAMAG